MKKLLYLVVLLVAVVACQEKQQQEQRTSQSTIDSITSAAILSQNIDRAIAVIDSFENTGVDNNWKGYHYNNRKGYHVDQSFTLYIRWLIRAL